MPFDTLSASLRQVAEKSMAHCRSKYGGTLKIEDGISDSILWRPTFFIRRKTQIIAVEVEDTLYPSSLKGAATDISHYDTPISVFQACTLDAYRNDPGFKTIAQLKEHGFGLITVDSVGNVNIQHQTAPLTQHISRHQFDRETKTLSRPIKVSFESAYDSYTNSVGQGLQEAGQIVEGLIGCLAKEAAKNGVIPRNKLRDPLANQIDALYATTVFQNHRHALAHARAFINEYRNTASHPSKTAREHSEKIRKCREGFIDSIHVAEKLKNTAATLQYRIRLVN